MQSWQSFILKTIRVLGAGSSQPYLASLAFCGVLVLLFAMMAFVLLIKVDRDWFWNTLLIISLIMLGFLIGVLLSIIAVLY